MEVPTTVNSTTNQNTGLVVIRNKIISEDIYLLANKSIGAIRIPQYYPADLCRQITNNIIEKKKAGVFVKAPHVQRIGMPHYDIIDVKSFEKYHETALDNIQTLREIYQPYISPIDKLRLELEERWPAGANLETLYGKKCFVGLCRIIEGIAGSVLEPHIDRLGRDSRDSYAANSLIAQMAANIYVATPDSGGELEIWMQEPSLEDYESELNKTESYYVNRASIGEPNVVIKPEIGDLILFNSRCFHAVKESTGGIRSSIAAFIGYRGVNHALSYWS